MIVALLSCFSLNALAQSGDNVSYEKFANASVLKGAKDGTLTLVIKNQKEMERVFGPSGFIGPSRIINFDNEFLVAVVAPKSIAEATLELVSLKRAGNKLQLSYTIDPTKKANNNNDRNFIALIVDRKEPMKVDFQEVSSDGAPMKDSKDVNELRNQVKYLTSENESLKNGVQELNDKIQKLEAERLYYIDMLKDVQKQNEQMKKLLRH